MSNRLISFQWANTISLFNGRLSGENSSGREELLVKIILKQLKYFSSL